MPDRLEQVAYCRAFEVRRIHEHDVAGLQFADEKLSYICFKPVTINRATSTIGATKPATRGQATNTVALR
jgi:hypothetical protein